MKRSWIANCAAALVGLLPQAGAATEGEAPAAATEAKAVGEFGYEARRPIMGAACPTCVWGPFAVVTKRIMEPLGWDLQICWNCNAADSPRFVAGARVPHDLRPDEIKIGALPPPKGPVDFGVTTERALRWAYDGLYEYAGDGPQPQLRLIANFEDPNFLAMASRRELGISNLAEIRERRLPVRLHTTIENDALVQPILEYYGLTEDQLSSWGGKIVTREEAMRDGVDVLIHRNASVSQNMESQIWTWATHKYDMQFYTLPNDLRETLIEKLGYNPVTMPVGYFRGVEEAIPTLEFSGQVVYGRDDMPEEFAYQLAKAMDRNRGEYLWSIRPFMLDPNRVWKAGKVPLHPGAERFYREAGYIE